MKEIWLKADEGSWEDRKPLITAGLESGVDAILVNEDEIEDLKKLGDVKAAAITKTPEESGADIPLVKKDSRENPDELEDASQVEGGGLYIEIDDKEKERFAAESADKVDNLVAIGEDWKIIPLENLIADIGDETKLVTGADSPEEVVTAFETLEKGSDAVLLDAEEPGEIKETVKKRDQAESEELELVEAEVTNVEQTEMADRVCVDTSSIMEHGEGMLVGSTSKALFFVQAETAESPYVASRPFRVNAGGVHQYIRVPGGETKYLSEIESGTNVQVVDGEGNARKAVVGRAKIEKRPMMLVEAEYEGEKAKALIQNAETIKLGTPEGPKAVTDLEEGDEVKIFFEDVGRHFGKKVEESLVEK
ncbi:MAG: 3-dehydroquinate synthase II [Candidatus Nanohalobium sp.]